MTTFRVGISAEFTRGDGKPTFPSCDWSVLEGTEGVEIEQMAPGNTLTQQPVDEVGSGRWLTGLIHCRRGLWEIGDGDGAAG
jgi:hypothetical protein